MRLMLAWGLIATGLAGPARADSPADAAKAKARQKQIDQMIEHSLVTFKVFADSHSETAMPAHSVLRFVNDTRGEPGESALVLWTQRRPAGSGSRASIPGIGNHLAHEFVTAVARRPCGPCRPRGEPCPLVAQDTRYHGPGPARCAGSGRVARRPTSADEDVGGPVQGDDDWLEARR